MNLTDDQLQTLIASELHVTGDPEFSANMPVWWELYTEKRAVAPRLQLLYVKRSAIDYLIGRVRDEAIDWEQKGVSQNDSRRVVTLEKARAEVHAEIVKIETRALAARVPVSGSITQVAPVTPQPTQALTPDPNDSRYTGDPLKRLMTRI